jgi:hypothetical protein
LEQGRLTFAEVIYVAGSASGVIDGSLMIAQILGVNATNQIGGGSIGSDKSEHFAEFHEGRLQFENRRKAG